MYFEIDTDEECVAISHQLHLPYPSKCNDIHGHNYYISAKLIGPKLNADGMIVDFTVVKAVIKKYDHTVLGKGFRNSTSEQLWVPDKCQPHVEPSTAENFGRVLLKEIQVAISMHNPDAKVMSVSLWETSSNRVVVHADEI